MPPKTKAPAVASRIHDFVRQAPIGQEQPFAAAADPFWQGLRALGSELWLDTGDIDAAISCWTREFSALTTNNTLLNAEVQKGIYDQLVREAAALVSGLDPQTRVIEIAFVLNATHGLRLARRFGGKVSVELHTDLAQDVDRSVAYGERFHAICPDHFIVKVPLTPAGLIATRRLRAKGIPVNFTLGFSARQNALAIAFAKPSYVNVFLGRLGAYAADNQLGDGKMLGEKATLATQRVLRELVGGQPDRTRLIAASLRDGPSVAALAGVDVFTMPVKCAADAKAKLDGRWVSQLAQDYAVQWTVPPAGWRADTLWAVPDNVRRLARDLDAKPPASAAALVDRAHQAGAGDLFPRLAAADLAQLAADGKIPKHECWAARIAAGELAADTLLNVAGLASFAADQAKLDDRIRRGLA